MTTNLRAVAIAAVVVVVAMLGIVVLRNAEQWSQRDCDLASSVAFAVVKGGPDSTQYCETRR